MVLKRFLKLAENLLHPLTMHHFGLALFLFFHLLLVRTSRQSQVICFFAFYGRKSQNCILLQYEIHMFVWQIHETNPDFRSVPNLKHQNQQKLPTNQNLLSLLFFLHIFPNPQVLSSQSDQLVSIESYLSKQ